LDTGSDCTLIPLEIVSTLQLRLLGANSEINGVGGGTILGFACYINLQLDRVLHKAIRVYGCPRDRFGDRVLIGRDILNQCCIEFDGLNLMFRFSNP
ncbi:Retroviral aspartyl protease, partial [Pseudanabaenaceae cyanobacterium LEGE 13415]|nr:Retroviral aspartyl protease [Pseudanabaenaceae cyanobacterium LEGE 13415]